jgi:hypothetical protein
MLEFLVGAVSGAAKSYSEDLKKLAEERSAMRRFNIERAIRKEDREESDRLARERAEEARKAQADAEIERAKRDEERAVRDSERELQKLQDPRYLEAVRNEAIAKNAGKRTETDKATNEMANYQFLLEQGLSREEAFNTAFGKNKGSQKVDGLSADKQLDILNDELKSLRETSLVQPGDKLTFETKGMLFGTNTEEVPFQPMSASEIEKVMQTGPSSELERKRFDASVALQENQTRMRELENRRRAIIESSVQMNPDAGTQPARMPTLDPRAVTQLPPSNGGNVSMTPPAKPSMSPTQMGSGSAKPWEKGYTAR